MAKFMEIRDLDYNSTTKRCSSGRKTTVLVLVIVAVIVTAIACPLLAVSPSSGNKNHKTYNSSSGNFIKPPPLYVGAFNIRSFGESKSQDKFAVDHIVEILSRYDIVLVQEVRDRTVNSLRYLWGRLNATGTSYGLVSSDRLGRTNYKEQYVFFYRINTAKMIGELQFDDSVEDIFEREPYTVEFEYFSVNNNMVRRFALMALHTKPKDTKTELAELPVAIHLAAEYFESSDGVIAMGDFNADCSYLSNRKKKELKIFSKESSYRSVLHDSEDTTAASTTDCAYDRAVIYGRKIKVKDAAVFNFQKTFQLSESDAKRISDHFPIEFMVL